MNLVAIHVYPIKSCRGTRLSEARVTERGLENDRRWMLTDAGGRFLSQREHPRMALIEPRLEDGRLRVTAPGVAPLEVDAGAPGPRGRVEIWSDRCDAIDQGDRAATWFSGFLGTPCRLVRQNEDSDRAVGSQGGRGPRARVSFADQHPFLLTAEESLRDLNERLPRPVPMDRFRPNLVVSGGRSFEEDSWRRIRLGEIEFTVDRPCARCAITTVDPESGRKGLEPLRTLATYRQGSRGVLFGQNLIHHHQGVLREGLHLAVLEREPSARG